MERVTLITVVHEYDTPQIFLQAHSLLKHWKGDKSWVIYTDDTFALEFVSKHILPLMIGWNVKISNKEYKATDGWIRQQIAKLYESSQVQTEYSLILDAKNFLIKSADIDTFLDSGIWCMELEDCSFYQKNMLISENFLGIKNNGKIPASITPWVWKTDIVKEVITKIPNFDQWETIPGSEWFLYWLVAQDKVKWISKGWVAGLWSGKQFVKISRKKINDLDNLNDLYWWTHHRGHISTKARLATKSILLKSKTITDPTLFRKWDVMSNRLFRKNKNHFLIYQ